MPIISDWYDSGKSILVQRFEGQWSLEEYFRHLDHTVANHVPDRPLHIIADFSASLTTPTRILGGMRYLQRKIGGNRGVSIFLNPSSTLENYFKLAHHIQDPASKDMYTARNFPEAVEIISTRSSF